MASRRQRREQLRREREARAERARALRLRVLAGVAVAILVLGGVFLVANRGGEASSKGGGGKARQYAFAVGDPGPGAMAPNFRLSSTTGSSYELAARRGKTVLLYFQEGLMCQPCWDQITDLEKQPQKLRSLGIDELVSITTDDLGQLRQKVADEGIEAPVLSDPDLKVSRVYETNLYGMMGDSRNGHSFLLVGADGRIVNRMDYGGEPDYTMYVPVDNLAADLRAAFRP